MKMKPLIALLLVTFTFCLSAKAEYTKQTGFEGHYLFHTTKKCIDFKKHDSLQWFDNNLNKKKSYYISFYHSPYHDAANQVAFLKKESSEWYENNVDKKKFYYENRNHTALSEIAFLKKKAIKWHDRNSQS